MPKRNKSTNKNPPRVRSETALRLPRFYVVSAGIALIILAIVISYLPAISGGFVLDDDLMLTHNPLMKAADGLYRFWCTTQEQDYWPMNYSSLWIEWRIWQKNTTGYHVTNLILHFVESLLIWIILRKLSIPGAFLAAMIFAVHPVNVESVAWISQRKNTLSMLFFLLSILWYLKHLCSRHTPCADPAHGVCGLPAVPARNVWRILSEPWYWLSLAAFVLAILSKGSVAVLPVLLLGIVCWLRPLTKWHLLRILPFFAIAAVLGVVNLWFQTHGTNIVLRTATFTERLLGAGTVVWFYLSKALFPVNLVFVYPRWRIDVVDPIWWVPLSAAMVVTAVLWFFRKSWSRPFLFAWGFFCVALLPVIGFSDVGFMRYSLVADRYQHIAIIGVVALAAAGWGLWRGRAWGQAHWVATAIPVVLVAALICLSWRQSGIYRDAIILYQAAIKKNPDFLLAHQNLAGVLVELGRFQEGIEEYEQALRLKPDYAEAHNNMAVALIHTNRYQEAIDHYRLALRFKPDYPEAFSNLGVALVKAGRPNDAIEHYEQALRVKPDYFEAQNNLGVVLMQTGRTREAIEHYEKAIQLNPDYAEAHCNLGNALAQSGRLSEAIEHFRVALRVSPDYIAALNRLGNALVQTGRPREAIEHYQQALRLKPDIFETHFNLGNALMGMGLYQQAIEQFNIVLMLNPNLPEAHGNLGTVLVQTGRYQEAIEHYLQALRLKPDFTTVYYNLALAYDKMHRSADAIQAAQKSLELAQSQGQTALARQIENWLKSYRAGLSK